VPKEKSALPEIIFSDGDTVFYWAQKHKCSHDPAYFQADKESSYIGSDIKITAFLGKNSLIQTNSGSTFRDEKLSLVRLFKVLKYLFL
jgi:hypothetical protein